MKFLFDKTLYEPLYNALVGLIDILPGADIGLAVIVLTILVKIILFPLSASSIRTQIKMKDLDADVKEINEKYKDNREEKGRKMLELYRENNVNPFSGILLLFIQIPVVLALYFVFKNAGFPNINTELLYSFVPVPDFVNTNFLGFINLTENKNVLVALFVGLSQYVQMQIVFKKNNNSATKDGKKNPMEDMMRTMQFQMKFILPILTFVFSLGLVSVIGLYWTISNLFAIGQEIYFKNKLRTPLADQE